MIRFNNAVVQLKGLNICLKPAGLVTLSRTQDGYCSKFLA